MKLIFAEDAKEIVQNSVGWPSNKEVICEQIDELPEVRVIPISQEQVDCPYCHSAYQYHSKGSIHGKHVAFKPTASRTDFKDWEIWMHEGESPCMMCFNRGGRGAYIDINYCPICGRDLRGDGEQ
jgi:hypothetical protein